MRETSLLDVPVPAQGLDQVAGLGAEHLVAVAVAERGARLGVLVSLRADPGRGLGPGQLLGHALGRGL
ncbi:hypothetical protein CW362_42100 [Streptomyces populi]|uniref:Uncharacterized protein n=1 Tax=Streptomyces populi TaxID=2058924 RepID=A0A2I0SB64_9ACTN|nr:hypothetical protein CW362_42100 [Streptomyces populi]